MTKDEGTESESVRSDDPRIQLAAQLRWKYPGWTWEQIAQELKISDRHLRRMRQTEAYEVAFREAGTDIATELGPEAIAVIRRAWRKDNPVYALEILRALQYLNHERIEMVNVDGDIDDELRAALAEYAAEHTKG